MAFFNKFPEIAAAFGQVAQDLVDKVATDVEETAQQNCPVDTGFLRDTIYVRTYTRSDYKGGGRVSKKAKQSGSYTLKSVPQPPNQYTAYVAVGASYGAFVELGTVKMSAQPFFFPAVEANRDAFEREAGDLEAQIRKFAGVE